MLLDATPDSRITTLQNIPVSISFKYLGIYVTPKPLEYVSLNLSPLLGRIRDKAKVWSKLQLLVVGKVNLIKMFFMP